jgi:hypothetical protein
MQVVNPAQLDSTLIGLDKRKSNLMKAVRLNQWDILCNEDIPQLTEPR